MSDFTDLAEMRVYTDEALRLAWELINAVECVDCGAETWAISPEGWSDEAVKILLENGLAVLKDDDLLHLADLPRWELTWRTEVGVLVFDRNLDHADPVPPAELMLWSDWHVILILASEREAIVFYDKAEQRFFLLTRFPNGWEFRKPEPESRVVRYSYIGSGEPDAATVADCANAFLVGECDNLDKVWVTVEADGAELHLHLNLDPLYHEGLIDDIDFLMAGHGWRQVKGEDHEDIG